MKALICTKPGSLDDLLIGEIAAPEIAPGHVIVDIEVAGVNFPDGLIVEGKHVFKPTPPFVPGAEGAGRIAAVAPDVTDLAIGDRVACLAPGGGAMGQRMLVPRETCYRVPDRVPLEKAAASLITYATTYYALKDRARLQPGETILVLGAAGGVGLAAVELAKLMGARVVAAASTAEKLDLARRCGADDLINYVEEPLKDALRGRIGLQYVDVVYDPVGGDTAEIATRLLGWAGRYLVIGFAAGEIPRLPINLFLVKDAALHGILWGSAAEAEPELHRANVAQLFDWIGEGRLNPTITARYPFDRVIDALRDVMGRRVLGKVVVQVGGS